MMEEKKDWLAELQKNTKQSYKLDDQVISDRNLRILDVPDVEWLIPNLIAFPSFTAVTGRPMSYKTAFCQWTARRIAAGLPLFDKAEQTPTHGLVTDRYQPRRVLFIEEEMSIRQMKGRTNKMKTFNEDNLFWMISKGFKFKDETWLENLRQYVKENQISCIFLDPFSSVAGLENENDNSEASELMDKIRKTFIQTEDNPCSIVIIHHPAKGDKGDSVRGAGDFLGKMDQAIVMDPQDKGRDGIHVRYIKHRDIDNTPEDFKIDLRSYDASEEKEFVYVGVLEKDDQKESQLDKQLRHTITTCQTLGMTRLQIAKVVGLSNTGDKFVRLWKSTENPVS